MTSEEQIEMLKEEYEDCTGDDSYTHEWLETLDAAIEALEQEPCKDAVSVTSVFEIMGNLLSIPYDFDRNITEKDVSESMDKIRELPRVTLREQRKGHWVKEESIFGWDGHSYQCSECGRSIHLDTEMEDLEDYPYCHCGTKMQEVKGCHYPNHIKEVSE